MFTSVQWCRILAAEIWRGERWAPIGAYGGLSSPAAVRSRIEPLIAALGEECLARARDAVATLRNTVAVPTELLEATEALVSAWLPGKHASGEAVLSASGVELQLLVVQSLAARLGQWPNRLDEQRDAEIARALLESIGPQEERQHLALIDVGRELYRAGDPFRAAVCFLDADRIHRTPLGLYQAAIALWRSERHAAGLWAIRACLLEPVDSFQPPGLLSQAVRVESSLRCAVEGFGDFGRGEIERAAALARELGTGHAGPQPRPTLA